MKKSILTLALFVFTTFVFGQKTQPDSTKKEFKNIIEVDATGLLKQFLFSSSNGGSGYYVLTPYMFSYKRIFNNNNAIRFGVGGTTVSENATTNDTIYNNQKNTRFNVGIGIEHYAYLTNRWNFFFGIDAIANFSEYKSEQENSAGSIYENEQVRYGYGVSPLAGIQFKINSRISVTTETRYDIVFSHFENIKKQIPDSPFDTKTTGEGMNTTFNPPVNVNFRIHF